LYVYIRMCHVTDDWVRIHLTHKWMPSVTHINESCHPYEWVMTRIWLSHVMSHMRMSHVAHKNESRHIYKWVMWHIRMSHVTHKYEPCHTHLRTRGPWYTHKSVMTHIWMRHVTHMTESCHTYEWVTSHIWMSHVTRMNESRHTYEWVMSHVWMSHVTHIVQTRGPSCVEQLLARESAPFRPACFGRCAWSPTEWQRCVRIFIFIRSFPHKNPIISGSFEERDLQLTASRASSPPCTRYVCFI